jgi:hypothetical protein
MPRVGEAVTDTVAPGGIADAFSTTPGRGINSKSASLSSPPAVVWAGSDIGIRE